MSRTYEIACTQCQKTLWIGQRDYIYGAPEYIARLGKFLHEHIEHPLVFCDTESSTVDDFEEVSGEREPEIMEFPGVEDRVAAVQVLGSGFYEVTFEDGRKFKMSGPEAPQVGKPPPFA